MEGTAWRRTSLTAPKAMATNRMGKQRVFAFLQGDYECDFVESDVFQDAVQEHRALMRGDTQLYHDGAYAVTNKAAWDAARLEGSSVSNRGTIVKKRRAVTWWNRDGYSRTEEFIFYGMVGVQDHSDALRDQAPTMPEFCCFPNIDLATGKDNGYIFNKNVFWTMALCWRYCRTTGVKHWDEDIEQNCSKVLEEPPVEVYCAECKEVARSRCKACKIVWYCGASCQKKHWPSHKPVCGRMTSACSEFVEIEFSETPDPLMNGGVLSFEERWDTAESYQCVACKKHKAFSDYSKSQIRQEEERKCKECISIDAAAPAPIQYAVCNLCHETLAASHFSLAQYRKGKSKRKCIDCVDAEKERKTREREIYVPSPDIVQQ